MKRTGVPWARSLVTASLVAVVAGCGLDDGTVTRLAALAECEHEPCVVSTYRVDALRLRDPHVYTDPLFVGCTDVTDDAPLGFAPANRRISESLRLDDDGDDFVDFAMLLQTEGSTLWMTEGRCPADDPRRCEWPVASERQTPLGWVEQGICLAPYPGTTTTGYEPLPRTVSAPCALAEPFDIVVRIDESRVRFREAEVAWVEDGELLRGLVTGFLTFEEAASAEVDGDPLDAMLPGHPRTCSSHDDTDEGPGGERGWWFYFDFNASPVELVEPGTFRSDGCTVVGDSPSGGALIAFGLFFIRLRGRRRSRAACRSRPCRRASARRRRRSSARSSPCDVPR